MLRPLLDISNDPSIIQRDRAFTPSSIMDFIAMSVIIASGWRRYYNAVLNITPKSCWILQSDWSDSVDFLSLFSLRFYSNSLHERMLQTFGAIDNEWNYKGIKKKNTEIN